MALIDEVRFAVNRTTTATNAALETELTRYINAAVLDLTETTSILPFEPAAADDLQKEAIITYACFMFEKDTNRKAQYKQIYDDLKTKMLLSSKYSDLGGAPES
jgi:hypothetical protein